MRILTIDVIGIPSGRGWNFIDANVFQDYDAIVVNPRNMESLYERVNYRNRDQAVLDSEYGQLIEQTNNRRRKEVLGLLRRGGVVVCFLQPRCSYTFQRLYKATYYTHTITNYDWLFDDSDRRKQLGDIFYSKGKSIEFIDTNHPFAEYLGKKPSWLAYVSKDGCPSWKILATSFEDYVLSLAKRIELGHIVFLPSDYDSHDGESLEKCIAKLMEGKEFLPHPNWAKEILVPGQDKLVSEIDKLNKAISTLESDREKTIAENMRLERWKYLLYAKGKRQLEPVVREALSLIGCNVIPQADKDSDGIVTYNNNIALLEVVGAKGTIKLRKFGELITNIGNYIAQEQKMVKGLLVGNPFCEERLDNRPPKDSQKQLFVKELITSAESQDINILLTTDLYDVICRILNNDMTTDDKAGIIRTIFQGKGLTNLSD